MRLPDYGGGDLRRCCAEVASGDQGVVNELALMGELEMKGISGACCPGRN